MAEKKDLDFTYTTIDKIFRLSIGETGDYSGAKYDGNFLISLEEVQRAKHKFIADRMNSDIRLPFSALVPTEYALKRR